MFEQIKNNILHWNNVTSDRQKLQHVYLSVTALLIMLAGVMTIFDAAYGHRIAFVAVIALGAFIMNGIVWHLLNSLLMSKLPTRGKRK